MIMVAVVMLVFWGGIPDPFSLSYSDFVNGM